MPDYAKMRGTSFVLPPSYPAIQGQGSIYVDGPNSNALTYRDHEVVDTPILGGVLTSTSVLIKRKRNITGSLIPANTVVALKNDGSICPVESDVVDNVNAIGTTRESIADGAYGAVLLLGASSPNVVDGMGFTSGDIIYASATSGVLTNDRNSIIGEIKILGIADCATDVQSAVATDLLISIGENGDGGGGSFFATSSATILRGFPVTINSSGTLEVVDISNEDSAFAFCGVTSLDCLIGGTANILTAGNILYDIPASFGLTGLWGKPIFVSHSGTLTTTKPDVGVGDFVSQDFILSVGITTKNPNTGTTDLILNPRIVGRLV